MNMNMIEKVAKAIKAKRDELIANALWQIYPQLAQAAISAMPSIKWQKIETLPDEYNTNNKEFLVWRKDVGCYRAYFNFNWGKYFLCDENQGFEPEEISHWAEINAPEVEE